MARSRRALTRVFIPSSLLLIASGVGVACSQGPVDEDEPVATSAQALELPGSVVKTAEFGRIEGARSGVNSFGAFTYDLPIQVPEGIAGVTPRISLGYSSQSGNGTLGVGWSLNAGSAIRRCRRTVSTHGVATSLSDKNGVLLDTGPFCLDGMLLVPLSRDANGTITFATEADDLSRITYNPVIGAPYFRIEKADGRSLKYSTVASVSRALDTTGVKHNHAFYLAEESFPGRGSIFYTYQAENNADGTVDDSNAARTVTEVRYALGAWQRTVKFVYSDSRADGTIFYEDGFKLATKKRLDRIELYGPAPNATGGYDANALAWSYHLNYCVNDCAVATPSRFTARTLLRSVKLCDSLNGCLPATKFDWNDATFSGAGELTNGYDLVSTLDFGPLDAYDFTKVTLTDLSGDGRDDLIYSNGPLAEFDEEEVTWHYTQSKNLRVRISAESTLPGAAAFGTARVVDAVGVDPQTIRVGDFNGDGKSDLLMAPEGSPRIFQYAGIGAGSPILERVSEMDSALSPLFSGSFEVPKLCATRQLPCMQFPDLVAIGDLDGDGTVDLLRSGRKGEDENDWYNRFERGLLMTPGTFSSRPLFGEYWGGSDKAFILFDLTGDGKSEMVLRAEAAAGLEPVQAIQQENRLLLPGCLLSDQTGDGLKDLVCLRHRKQVELSINTGRGFLPLTLIATLPFDQFSHVDWFPGDEREFAEQMLNKVVSSDFDGDGREDLLLLDYNRAGTPFPDYQATNLVANPAPMAMLFSREGGYKLYELPATAALGRLVHAYRRYSGTAVGDVDGDGLPDIVSLSQQTPTSPVLLHTFRASRPSPPASVQETPFPVLTRRDVMTGVYDGLKQGAAGRAYGERITYADLPALSLGTTVSTYTSCDGCAARGPLVVVTHSAGRLFDPLKPTRYSYAGARQDRSGRGFLGFDKVVEHDVVFASQTTRKYSLGAYSQDVGVAFDPPGLRTGDFQPVATTRKNYYPWVGSPSITQTVVASRYGGPDVAGTSQVKATCDSSISYVESRKPETYLGRRQSAQRIHIRRVVPDSQYGTICDLTPDVVERAKFEDFDTYFNPGKVTYSTDGGTARVTETQFYNSDSTSGYVVGRPLAVTETRTKSGSTTTQTTKYEYLANRLAAVWTLPRPSSNAAFPSSAPSDETASEADLYRKVSYVYGFGGAVTQVIEQAFDAAVSTAAPISRKKVFRYESPAGQPDYAYPSQVVDAAGWSVKYQYHPSLGRILQQTDPNGRITRYSYNGLGRHIGTDRDGGQTTVASFVAPPTSHAEVSPYAVSTVSSVTFSNEAIERSVVDFLGRPIAEHVLLVDGTYSEKRLSYDARGLPSSVTVPKVIGSAGSSVSSTIAYDAHGRRVRETRPGLVDKTWTYPDAFTVTETEGARQTHRTVDVDGHLIHTTQPYQSTLRPDALVTGTSIGYDASGAPVTYKLWKDANNPDERLTRRLTYDALGRVTSLDDPGTGFHEYRYNGFGEARFYKNGNAGSARRRVHDVLGRVTREEGYTVPRRDDEFVWDVSSNGRGMISSTRSIVRSNGNDNGTSIDRFYKYDSFGRLKEYGITESPSTSSTATYSMRVIAFDSNGRPAVVRYPSQVVVNGVSGPQAVTNPLDVGYSYTRGYHTKITSQPGTFGQLAHTLWQLNEATPLRMVTAVANGASIDTVDFDVNGRVSGGSMSGWGSFAYEYDGYGEVRARTTLDGSRDEMLYDGLGRLEVVKHFQAETANEFRREHWFDDYGSMTAVKTFDRSSGGTLQEERTFTLGATAGGRSLPYAVSTELTTSNLGSSARSFMYDSIGRRIGVSGSESGSIDYDNHNLPVSIRQPAIPHATFRYDASGHRAVKTMFVGGTFTGSTFYLDDFFEDRSTGGGRTYVSNLKAYGRTVVTVSDTFTNVPTATRKLTYPHSDPQGTIVSATDQIFRYDVFGQRVGADGRTPAVEPSSLMRDGFTGHEHEEILGSLINMKGRIYDPAQRRFLTPDPVVSVPSQSNRWNPYAYAHNNPTRYIDPTGFDPPRAGSPNDFDDFDDLDDELARLSAAQEYNGEFKVGEETFPSPNKSHRIEAGRRTQTGKGEVKPGTSTPEGNDSGGQSAPAAGSQSSSSSGAGGASSVAGGGGPEEGAPGQPPGPPPEWPTYTLGLNIALTQDVMAGSGQGYQGSVGVVAGTLGLRGLGSVAEGTAVGLAQPYFYNMGTTGTLYWTDDVEASLADTYDVGPVAVGFARVGNDLVGVSVSKGTPGAGIFFQSSSDTRLTNNLLATPSYESGMVTDPMSGQPVGFGP